MGLFKQLHFGYMIKLKITIYSMFSITLALSALSGDTGIELRLKRGSFKSKVSVHM